MELKRSKPTVSGIIFRLTKYIHAYIIVTMVIPEGEVRGDSQAPPPAFRTHCITKKLRIKQFNRIFLFQLLRLNQRSLQSTAAGKLVNLMSNDVARFDYAFMFLHYFWMIPLQSAAVLYFMFRAAGWAPIVGLFSVMLLILPIQGAYAGTL